MPFRQWAHDLWLVDYESGVDASFFKKMAYKLQYRSDIQIQINFAF